MSIFNELLIPELKEISNRYSKNIGIELQVRNVYPSLVMEING